MLFTVENKKNCYMCGNRETEQSIVEMLLNEVLLSKLQFTKFTWNRIFANE